MLDIIVTRLGGEKICKIVVELISVVLTQHTCY